MYDWIHALTGHRVRRVKYTEPLAATRCVWLQNCVITPTLTGKTASTLLMTDQSSLGRSFALTLERKGVGLQNKGDNACFLRKMG